MIKKLSTIFFVIFISLIIFFEGTGIGDGRQLAYHLVLIMPFFLFMLDIIRKESIVIPKKISIFFFFFLLLSVAPTVFSVNIQHSFELNLFYVVTFLMFIYAYNHKIDIVKPLTILIVVFSFIFYTYSSLINVFLQHNWIFLIPKLSDNFVYSTWPSHNHLGDFFILPVIISFYALFTRKQWFSPFVVTLLSIFVVLISFSRSAYMAIGISVLVMYFVLKIKNMIYHRLLSLITVWVTVALFIVFSFIILSDFRQAPYIRSVTNILEYNFDLRYKSLISSRNEYISQALQGIKERPFFGVGGGNFSYISQRHTEDPLGWSSSSHNIFFDTAVEEGIFASILLLLIVILMLKNSRSHYFLFCLLGLLINFQTDYTFTFYSFLLLFFIFGGLLYKEENEICIPYEIFMIVPSLLLISSSLIVWSSILFLQNKIALSLKLYPLSQEANQYTIEQLIKEGMTKNPIFYKSILQYQSLFKADQKVLSYISDLYVIYGDNARALEVSKQAYYWYQYQEYGALAGKLYVLEKEQYGEKAAKLFINLYFDKIIKINQEHKDNVLVTHSAVKLCKDIYKICPYRF